VPDVIISDVAFTDGTVVDLCRHVRTVRPSVRVVVVTACADPDIVYQTVFAKLGVIRRTQAVALGARLRRRAPGQWPLS
jgi:DNA-binding NarL/FixJ family response regulator